MTMSNRNGQWNLKVREIRVSSGLISWSISDPLARCMQSPDGYKDGQTGFGGPRRVQE